MLFKGVEYPVSFPVRAHLHCAVSGGADSVALAILAAEHTRQVTLHHVDHGLREGSSKEALLVAELARKLQVEFCSHSVVISGRNVEEKAREARYGVMPDDVLTGHTLDDQAETFLLALGRGAGAHGLRGIDATNRPLLQLRRRDTETICKQFGFDYFEDPSNTSDEYTRNRVRHELLPLLADIFGRDPAPIIVRTQGQLKADTEFLDTLADRVSATNQVPAPGTPEVLLSRISRRLLREHDVDVTAERVRQMGRVLTSQQKGFQVGGYYFSVKNKQLVATKVVI